MLNMMFYISAIESVCEDGFVPLFNRCYKSVPMPQPSYESAERECLKHRSYLASVDSYGKPLIIHELACRPLLTGGKVVCGNANI